MQGLTEKYVLLHLYPIFQKKIAYGSKNFPWSTFKNKTIYKKGICPVAENLQDKTFLGLQIQLYDLKKKDIDLIILAFKKVWRKFGKVKKKSFFVVCHDAGGAELISSWLKKKKIKFSGKITGPAKNIFKRKKVKFFNKNYSSEIKKADFVLAGSGWTSKNEIKTIALAKKYKKKTICF